MPDNVVEVANYTGLPKGETRYPRTLYTDYTQKKECPKPKTVRWYPIDDRAAKLYKERIQV